MVTEVGESADRPGLAPFEGPAFKKLAQWVSEGRCILFLGAGVHHPPPADSPFSYPEQQRPPLAGALAKQLASDCGFANVCPGESETNLQRVALCYERELSRKDLVDQIRRAVEGGSEPSAAVRALAELPFPLIMTTNYDTLFERALKRDGVGKRPVVRVYNPDRSARTEDFPGDGEPDEGSPFLFKMHGDIDKPESIVVTDEDYITFVLRMNDSPEAHPVPETFRYRLNRVPTLFVGYGLLDFNLRLLFRMMRSRLDPAQRPDSFSVDVRPDPLVSTVWTRDLGLRFIVEDVWKFVPRLYREVLGREMPL